jgi:hypothetical protein
MLLKFSGNDTFVSDALKKMEITDSDIKKARWCLGCPVCKHARKRQKGLLFWFVKNLEGKIRPFCKAYEKVYGRKAHEPMPE